MINSTVGVAGLIDVAGKIGIPGTTTISASPWARPAPRKALIWCCRLLGPKPPRDLVGMGVDIAFDPLTYMSWHNSTLS